MQGAQRKVENLICNQCKPGPCFVQFCKEHKSVYKARAMKQQNIGKSNKDDGSLIRKNQHLKFFCNWRSRKSLDWDTVTIYILTTYCQ